MFAGLFMSLCIHTYMHITIKFTACADIAEFNEDDTEEDGQYHEVTNSRVLTIYMSLY